MRAFGLSLAFLLALSSCSKKQDQESARSLVHEIPAASLSAALVMTDSAQLQCADASNCPENVGLFAGASTDSVFTCTAFLVGGDLVATNSHCLPSAVKMLPDLCAERVQVLLPAANGHPEERLRCKEIVQRSERPNPISPDFALIRLEKPTGRIAIAVENSGVKPNENYLAYKMFPAEGASGTIRAQQCKAVAGSYRFPLYRDKTDPIFVTGDCPSVPGNSGAPLLDSSGKAVGIFQAELGLSAEQINAWSPYLKPGEEFSPLALGTSLRCLDGSCPNFEEDEVNPPRIEDFLASLQGDLEKISAPYESAIFRWKRAATKRKLLEREETLAPECFRPLENWIGAFLASGYPAYLMEARIELKLPVYTAKMRFNRYMQASAEVRLEREETRHYLIHPDTLAQNGSDQMEQEGGESARIELCPLTASE